MNKLEQKLTQLVENKQLTSFVYEEQVPSIEGDTKFRLIDKLTLVFPNGDKLNLSTFCSGCRENTTIEIDL